MFEPLGKCSTNKQRGRPSNPPGVVTNVPTEKPGAGARARRSRAPRSVLRDGEVTVRAAQAGTGLEATQPEVGEGELDGVVLAGGEGEVAGEGQSVPPGPGYTETMPGARLSGVSLVAGCDNREDLSIIKFLVSYFSLGF